VSGSILCTDGIMKDCNTQATDDSGLADHVDTCDEYGGKYCNASNT